MKESIKLFLRSNVSEDDAYNIPKEGLVTLREYFETAFYLIVLDVLYLWNHS